MTDRIDTAAEQQTCVVVGASHAGSTLALQLRKEGWTGPIKLVGAESELPYHRPPLSKDFLAGKKELDAIRLRPAKVYEDNDIELMLGTQVLSVDREGRRLQLKNGESLKWDKLALCTGASVVKIPFGRDLDNLFYIRTAADVKSLRDSLRGGGHAVVVGGGYVGLEAAAVLAESGMQITVVEAAERVLSRVTGPQLSAYVEALHEARGTRMFTGKRVAAIESEGKLAKVVLQDGAELTADFVIVGIGIIPSFGLAEAAGLDCRNGILVDETARSSDPDIYAAGDCSNFPSALYDRRLRLESVQNATEQGRVAAANIYGRKVVYDAVPWFWSDQFDKKIQMAGVSEGFDEAVLRGSADIDSEDGFSLFYLREGVLIAADCVNNPREFMLARKLVQARVEPVPDKLADEDYDLGELIASSN